MQSEENSLQAGIAAFKAGDKAKARFYLLRAVRQDPKNENAWGWLSNTAETKDERIHCLRQIVTLNPQNRAAEKLLSELESQDWAEMTPSANPPKIVPQVEQPFQGSPTVHLQNQALAATSSETVQTIIIILLVVMVLYWLVIGLLQIAFSLAGESSLDVLCWGSWNIIISVINGLLIPQVVSRKKKALEQLYFLSIVGSAFGIFQMVLAGAYIQVCAIPIYILLGILAYTNKERFTN